MTIPAERYRAVKRTHEFLQELLDAKATPRVPREIRQRARSLLKHYPRYYDMEIAAEKAPEVFGGGSAS